MKIAIGTLRAPKVEGIKEAVASCPYFSEVKNEIEYILENVSSDISSMPLSVEEIMRGAKNRADNLLKAGIRADYYVGIEGGSTRLNEKAYVIGCVYVRDIDGTGHYGFSSMISMPKLVEKKLYEEGLELGPVMGELSGRIDIRSENGSIGAWTNDMFTRKDEFGTAFKMAIAPFYNEYYRLT